MISQTLSRDCPRCVGVLTYPNIRLFRQAEKRKSVCKPCRTAIANKSPLRNSAKEANAAWKGYKGVGYSWFSKYFERSQRKRTGSITIEDAYNQLEKQGFKCALTGIDLPWSEESGMSIDRIDSKKEYELNNIQLVHKDVNLMKNHFNEDYFIHICKLVAKTRG